jgi:hypothetical protein
MHSGVAGRPKVFIVPNHRQRLVPKRLTTFSTFGYETLAMIRDDEYLRAAGNAGMHVILGLALVWLGYALTTSR